MKNGKVLKVLWVKGFASEYNSAVLGGVFVTNALFVLSAVELYRCAMPCFHSPSPPDSAFSCATRFSQAMCMNVCACVCACALQIVEAGGQEGELRDQNSAALLPHACQHLHDRHVRQHTRASLLSRACFSLSHVRITHSPPSRCCSYSESVFAFFFLRGVRLLLEQKRWESALFLAGTCLTRYEASRRVTFERRSSSQCQWREA
jgi:hypothetical protein